MLFWSAQDNNTPSTMFFRSEENEESEEGGANVRWMKLHRGTLVIIAHKWEVLNEGPLKSVFEPWMKVSSLGGRDYMPPSDLVEEQKLSALSAAWENNPLSNLSSEQITALNRSLFMLKRCFALMHSHHELSGLDVAISFFSTLPEMFEMMLEEKLKEVLIIVAHFCILLKRQEHVSWMRGKGRHLLLTVLGVLGEGWEEFVTWPVQDVLGREWRSGRMTMSVDYVSK